ncbi:MAG: inorganic phosphate transporter [Candidatus Gracilibacteria bacterium]|nr:inorganic phosphate transporter [Candidatus Gracilibacteria bacterium]MDD3646729.1 inorganic phosphate transporter [Candidatus Gracilibacteria bacterium]
MINLLKQRKTFKYEIFVAVTLIVVTWVFFFQGGNTYPFLLMAAILGILMAASLGANDVANNMGPAVGSKVLTLTGAIIIAAIFEASGALIAGGDVVSTIKDGIIDQSQITNPIIFMSIMMATLLGASLWIAFATLFKAPVSATHSVIGALIGAGLMAFGLSINWDSLFIVVSVFTAITGISILIGLFFKYLIKSRYENNIKLSYSLGIVLFLLSLYVLYNYLFVDIYSITNVLNGVSIVDWSQILQIAASWIISPVMGGLIAVIIILAIRKTILKQSNRSDAAKKWVPIFVGIMAWAFATYLALKGLKKVIHITPELAIFGGYVIAVIVFIGLRLYLSSKRTILKNSKKFINKLFNVPLIFAVALLSFAHGANDVANAIGPVAAINETIKDMIAGKTFGASEVGIPFWVMLIGALGIATGLMAFGGRLIKTVGSEITKLNQIRAFAIALSATITVIIASHLGLPVSSTHVSLGGIFGVGLLREHMKRLNGKDKDYIEKGMIKNIALAWIITLPVSALISAVTYFMIIKLV